MRGVNLTELEFMLLNTLITEGRTHPYALGRAVEERAGRGVVSLGALYKALHRLAEVGYVDSEWESGEPREMKRPRRRFYQVTGIGQKALARSARLRAALHSTGKRGLSWQP